MSFQTILDNESITVQYYPAEGYIQHTFHGPQTGEPFRRMMNIALDAFIANGGTKWLSDDRKNAQFAPEDIEFALGDWGPRAAASGWKFWALVVPESLAGQEGMTAIVSHFYELGVRVAIFTEVDEAREWLLSV